MNENVKKCHCRKQCDTNQNTDLKHSDLQKRLIIKVLSSFERYGFDPDVDFEPLVFAVSQYIDAVNQEAAPVPDESDAGQADDDESDQTDSAPEEGEPDV